MDLALYRRRRRSGGSPFDAFKSGLRALWSPDKLLSSASPSTILLRRSLDSAELAFTEVELYNGTATAWAGTANLFLQSQAFDNASWSKSAASIVANVETAPDGTATADALIPDGTSAIHGVSQSVNILSDKRYTISFYAKPAGYNFVAVNESMQSGTTIRTYFNVSTGTIGTIGAGHTASIEAAANGYYRCSITFTVGAARTSGFGSLIATNADNTATFTGNGTSGVYIWGAQINGGTVAQTYTPTTSAIVAANAFSVVEYNQAAPSTSNQARMWFDGIDDSVSFGTGDYFGFNGARKIEIEVDIFHQQSLPASAGTGMVIYMTGVNGLLTGFMIHITNNQLFWGGRSTGSDAFVQASGPTLSYGFNNIKVYVDYTAKTVGFSVNGGAYTVVGSLGFGSNTYAFAGSTLVPSLGVHSGVAGTNFCGSIYNLKCYRNDVLTSSIEGTGTGLGHWEDSISADNATAILGSPLIAYQTADYIGTSLDIGNSTASRQPIAIYAGALNVEGTKDRAGLYGENVTSASLLTRFLSTRGIGWATSNLTIVMVGKKFADQDYQGGAGFYTQNSPNPTNLNSARAMTIMSGSSTKNDAIQASPTFVSPTPVFAEVDMGANSLTPAIMIIKRSGGTRGDGGAVTIRTITTAGGLLTNSGSQSGETIMGQGAFTLMGLGDAAGARSWAGSLQVVAVYDRAVSDTELASLEAQLRAKYGI